MTTIINSPPSIEGNSFGMIFGIFAIVIVGLLFFYFGVPALRQIGTPQMPVINVPSKVDVNIKQTP